MKKDIEQLLIKIDSLCDLILRTQKYAATDPETSLIQARKSVEAICRYIYASDIGAPGKIMLDDLIKKLDYKGLIPPKMKIPLNTIKAYGNYAVHSESSPHDEINIGYITPCLSALAQVSSWFFLEYLKIEIPIKIRENTVIHQGESEIQRDNDNYSDVHHDTDTIDKSSNSKDLLCEKCKNPIQKDWKNCPFCESVLRLFCPECNYEVEKDWKICPECKTKFSDITNNINEFHSISKFYDKNIFIPCDKIEKEDGIKNEDKVIIRGIAIPLFKKKTESVQDFVKKIMHLLLDNNILSKDEIERLKNKEYCSKIFFLQFPLLREISEGYKDSSGRGRYWSREIFGGNFYVCSQWWKQYHSIYLKKISYWLNHIDDIKESSSIIGCDDKNTFKTEQENAHRIVSDMPHNLSRKEIMIKQTNINKFIKINSNLSKRDAIAIINAHNNVPLTNATTHFANINSGKSVWWFDIPVKKFISGKFETINLLLYDNNDGLLHHLSVNINQIKDNLDSVYIREDKECISLELSAQKYNRFQDIRPGSGRMDFSQFLVKTVTIPL